MSRQLYRLLSSLNRISEKPVVKCNHNIDISKEVSSMSFGKNLSRFRKEKGLTQEDLVKKSSVAISQIRRYETDKSSPTLDVVTRLARALGISIDELVFDKASGIAAGKLMDRELLEQFEMISALDEDERGAVKKILEGVIVKHQVDKMLRPKAEKSWSQRFREITGRLAKGAESSSQDEIDQVIDEAVAAVRSKAHAHS
ncbi:MAG: helix-turn-helix transcriptional regulator [Candidatus Tectomicrobia bacterium]|uniref:Helix-turn-helix transcriptional regulator n=1 Tax=Tectimicrobiota bacterium TaxID=2528274 RepID=A0A933LQL9_UNCTE|nr:helix-turn-helix transcriptional regulator [Candidatus Tectomicrobia bacterium]